MKILGITGGIGSGKSTVAGIFASLSIPVYNSDTRAKDIYFLPEIRLQVEALLGKKAYAKNKALNKDFIRQAIFSNEDLRKKLNAIIHPAVASDFAAFKQKWQDKAYVIKETALLFEAGIDTTVDRILTVTSNNILRDKRLAKRSGLGTEEIEKIALSQMPDSLKIKRSDWVIENNEEDLLIPQVLKIHRALSG